MNRQLLINVGADETRVAMVADDRLDDLVIERGDAGSLVGNIYLGRVVRVVPGVAAAFVECGLPRAGFLAVGDIEGVPRDRETEPRIADFVHEGQALAVQVVKDAVGEKGSRVSTRLTLPSRYVVLVPGGAEVALSRRIDDEAERARLTAIFDQAGLDGHGYIVRTAAEGVGDAEIAADVAYVKARWREVAGALEAAAPPEAVFVDLEPVLRCLRDKLTANVSRVIIDDGDALAEARQFCERFMPALADRLEPFTGPGALFDAYEIQYDIDQALEARVRLPSGGTVVIEETEALTVIDVNSGRLTDVASHAELVMRTNHEAAREIARQLRVRNIAGIVVVDFVGMDTADEQQRLLDEFGQALAADRALVRLAGLSPLGLVELTRKRTREPLSQVLSESCRACAGLGRVKSARAVANDVMRAVTREARHRPGRPLSVVASPEVVALLEGGEAGALAALERHAGTAIDLIADATFARDRYEVIDP